MKIGLAYTIRAFRDTCRRRGYPIDILQANDAVRSPEFSAATKRSRGHDADGTTHGLTFTTLNTVGIWQVADSEMKLHLQQDGMRVSGEAVFYLPPELIDPADYRTPTGNAYVPKITDEFILLPAGKAIRYAVAGRNFESLETYTDTEGNVVFHVIWCDRIEKQVVPAVEPSWTPGEAA